MNEPDPTLEELLTAWDDGEHVELARSPQVTRLAEIGRLARGWLDGDGEAVTRDALKAARRMLVPGPRIYPTPEGGIQFEWSLPDHEVSVTIGPDGAVTADSVKASNRKQGGAMILHYQSPEGHTTKPGPGEPDLSDTDVNRIFRELTGKGYRGYAGTNLDNYEFIKSPRDARRMGAEEIYFTAPQDGG